jgi:hypothetical protein
MEFSWEIEEVFSAGQFKKMDKDSDCPQEKTSLSSLGKHIGEDAVLCGKCFITWQQKDIASEGTLQDTGLITCLGTLQVTNYRLLLHVLDEVGESCFLVRQFILVFIYIADQHTVEFSVCCTYPSQVMGVAIAKWARTTFFVLGPFNKRSTSTLPILRNSQREARS